MGLLEIKPTEGFVCPGCRIFSENPNEIARKDGICSNCGECFVMQVKIIPLDQELKGI